jgi:cell division protein FtsB
MKSKEEKEMEKTQAEVRRLERELETAKEAAYVAWREYVSSESKRSK